MEAHPDAGSEARLEELRQRWEADRGSRVFLQLAEELRRTGHLEEAIAVLGVGLGHHPSWGAAQVALARCRLEAGQAEAACVGLEAVVRKDPTQMVAYRLLVDGYLALRDAAAARDRLDLYAELNPQAEDLDELERRVAGMETSAGSEPPAAPELEASSFAPPPESAAPAPPPEVEAKSPLPLAPLGAPRLGDDLALPDSIDLDLETPSASAAKAPLSSTPEVERSRAGSSAGGREERSAPPQPSTPRVEPPVAAAPRAESLSAESAGPRVESLPAETAGRRGDTGSRPLQATDSGPFAVPPTSSQPIELRGLARPPRALRSPKERSAAREVASERAPETGTGSLQSGPPSETGPSEAPSGLSETIESGASPSLPETPTAPEMATSTLGRLYLRQGYSEEARDIFERVLERDPDNAEARTALGLAAAPSGPASAATPAESLVPSPTGRSEEPPGPPARGAAPEAEESEEAAEPLPSMTLGEASGRTSAPVTPAEPAVEPEREEPEPGGPGVPPSSIAAPPPPAAPVEPVERPEAVSQPMPAAPPGRARDAGERPTARELLSGRRPPGPGVTDRKVAVLEAYLERVREGRQRDVP